jgi:hypothetical protein
MPFLLFAVLLAAVLANAGVSFAQDSTVSLDDVFAPLRPYLAELMSLLVAAFMAWLVTWLRNVFKLQIEAKHREALQSALDKGAKLVLEQIDKKLAGKTVDVKSPFVANGVTYVLESVPDAVNYFGLSPERVAELIKPHLLPSADAMAQDVSTSK